MIMVKIYFKDGSTDLKEVFHIEDICLDGVESLKVIRDERKTKVQ